MTDTLPTDPIGDLMEIADGYLAEVETDMSLTSSELIEQKMLKLEDFRNNLFEGNSSLSDGIDALRKKKRDLDLQDERIATALKRYKSKFWSLKNAEKELKYRQQS